MPDPVAMDGSIRTRIKTYLIDPAPVDHLGNVIPWIYREDVRQDSLPDESHVIIDIVPGRGALVGTGAPRLWRTHGALVFRIATPLTDGRGPNAAIGRLIYPYFLGLLDASVTPHVRYGTPNWSPSEIPEETMFIGRTVCPWQIDTYEA